MAFYITSGESGQQTDLWKCDELPEPNSSTYALVIGISDYQVPDIPDLKYADKDAEPNAWKQ